LSEALGGPKAPGIGFALGLDRFVIALQSESEVAKTSEPISAYIAPLGSGMNTAAAKLARELRAQGVALDLGDESFRLKKSFEAAERAGAQFVIIVGENEVKADAFAVKDIKSGEQVTVSRGDLSGMLKR
jgi:histidyl-tRNA synthetase